MEVSAETEHALSVWAPRRQMTLAQARKRSSMVSLLRLAFTAGAAIAAGIMIGHLAANAFSASPSSMEKLSRDQVVTMVNPRFTGRDAAGQAFVITADTAQRRMDGGEKIDLTNPDMVSDDGTRITAPAGVYDEDAQTLDLYEDVQVENAKGYKFGSTSARVFIQEGRVEGLEPLQGTGPLGDVRCDTYEIVDEGDQIYCTGNVEMTIIPGESNGTASEAGNETGNEERVGDE